MHAVSVWSGTHFGNLDVEQITRTVIVSSLFLSFGFEIALSSLLLGMFRLNVRIPFMGDARASDGFVRAAAQR